MKSLITIVGPTAIGKTSMAIYLAKKLNTSIISADSRQFYSEMEIGTAKPTKEELADAKHYFINSHSIYDKYSAGDFERDALAKIDELFKNHDVLIMVGGSGLFIDAVCKGLDDLPTPNAGVREHLNMLHEQEGLAFLQEQLRIKDPDYYQTADIDNPQRVIRALEVYETTGIPFSFYRKQQQKPRPFNVIKIGLNIERPILYDRINKRVDMMMQLGLLNEVRSLTSYQNLGPLITVGYTELFDHLAGKMELDEAVEKIKQNTRRFAKRQITWFKKDQNTVWFEPHMQEHILRYIKQHIND